MIAKLPTKDQILEMESQGLVTIRPHNTLPLRIVNYTPKAQYERAWTPELLSCRGLIYDNDWNLIARPFPKFFNYEEHFGDSPVCGPLPQGSFTATDKMDGSLGILWRYGPEWGVATRGSFHSDQAIKAKEIAMRQGWDDIVRTLPGARVNAAFGEEMADIPVLKHTAIFEILYPENRIVVDYGQAEMLVPLAVIETLTGEEEDMTGVIGFPDRKNMSIEELMKPRKNAEGYVLRYENGQRVKIKHEEYVRLHRIVTGLSSTSIWEHLSSGGTLEQLLDPLPDEWMDWAREEAHSMLTQHMVIVDNYKERCNEICIEQSANGGDRKDFAEVAKKDPNPGLLFLAYDVNNEGLSKAVWRLIKPKYRKFTTADVC